MADTEDGDCSHGDLRINSRTDNSNDFSSEGRLEVCINRAWGTICDTSFGTRDAQVACTQLGYDGEGMLIPHNYWYEVRHYTFILKYIFCFT